MGPVAQAPLPLPPLWTPAPTPSGCRAELSCRSGPSGRPPRRGGPCLGPGGRRRGGGRVARGAGARRCRRGGRRGAGGRRCRR